MRLSAEKVVPCTEPWIETSDKGNFGSPSSIFSKGVKQYKANTLRLVFCAVHFPKRRNSYNTMTSVPAVRRSAPTIDFTETFSCRKTKARMSVIATLSLSTGTTFDASPVCSAR